MRRLELVVQHLDRPLDDGGRLFLVEPPLASTHILKPDPARQVTPHLVVNEHFCMSLARRMKLPVAEVSIYRTPRPVLVVRRFDRVVVITSSVSLRRKRAASRLDEREERLISDAEKVRRADFVFRNDGTLEELEAFVGEVWKQLLAQVEA